MKTTMMFRSIANPRRAGKGLFRGLVADLTLASLKDAESLHAPEQPEHPVHLPTQTANPRRTILTEAPAATAE